jgi:diphthamide synthase (EF-2-diphthine--ammonia ligase)
MKYVALLSGGKDSCYNLVHCAQNGHELVAAASLGPEPGKGPAILNPEPSAKYSLSHRYPRGT